jgi:hypothetical protein
VNNPEKKTPGNQATPDAERRRIASVAHDERGNAFVNWRDAPADHERPVLEILGEGSLGLRKEDISYDPYARARAARESTPLRKVTGGTTRTDLRRLSEHIKLMRALEERKRNGADDED